MFEYSSPPPFPSNNLATLLKIKPDQCQKMEMNFVKKKKPLRLSILNSFSPFRVSALDACHHYVKPLFINLSLAGNFYCDKYMRTILYHIK